MNNLSQLPPPPTGQTGLSFNELKNLPPPPSGQQGLTLNQIPTGSQNNQPTTNNPQLVETAATKGATGAFKVAQGLGIAKLGMGLATAGRVASGSINQTGADEYQMQKDQQTVITKLQQLRAQGVPRTDLNYMQLENYLKRASGQTAPTQAQIDPGTQLSNREVIGSAIDTAGLVLGSGEFKGATEAPQALSAGSKIWQATKTGAKVGDRKRVV